MHYIRAIVVFQDLIYLLRNNIDIYNFKLYVLSLLLIYLLVDDYSTSRTSVDSTRLDLLSRRTQLNIKYMLSTWRSRGDCMNLLATMSLWLFFLGSCTRVRLLDTKTQHLFRVGSFDYNVNTWLSRPFSWIYKAKQKKAKKEEVKQKKHRRSLICNIPYNYANLIVTFF